MDQWLEVQDSQKNWQYINPAQVASIVLLGDKQAPEGVRVMIADGGRYIEVVDPASVERLRQAAYKLAGLGAEGEAPGGQFVPLPPPTMGVQRPRP